MKSLAEVMCVVEIQKSFVCLTLVGGVHGDVLGSLVWVSSGVAF